MHGHAKVGYIVFRLRPIAAMNAPIFRGDAVMIIDEGHRDRGKHGAGDDTSTDDKNNLRVDRAQTGNTFVRVNGRHLDQRHGFWPISPPTGAPPKSSECGCVRYGQGGQHRT
jgi:hypothetical protein